MNQQSVQTVRPKPKREKVHLRVIKGGFSPADKYAESMLRDKKLRVGDLVKAEITKLRNPKFNRLVHKLGLLCAQNIDEFHGMDGHKVIKRLQLEGNIYCDEIAIKPYSILIIDSVLQAVKPILNLFGMRLTDSGLLVIRTPRSLSFDSMDESEFHDAAKQVCRLIAERYWKDLEPEQIESMVNCMVDE